MEPQQWMQHEWIARVTTQEEQTEWLPSLAQQKLHPRPRSQQKPLPRPRSTKDSPLKTFVLYILIYFCCFFPLWLVFENGIFYLQAITNGVVAFLVLFIFPLLGFCLLVYAGRDQT